ncbi:unnamed protein product [Oikopleura dioica]|uniref:UBX domain-containing protein 4 n=1 Tax=Oikopleura dioica TaxID=34765 RepID=E4WZX4_OIKDI|nr:unnamed protein product [Oikopleura dioica]
MRSKIQPGCIVLRIVDGSQEFSDFNDFWTVHGTPMIFFMNGKGEMVRDPLAGAVTEAQILRALVAIKTEQMPSVPRQENSQEESVQKNSEMPGTSETEEEKAEEIRLKTEQYRQKIEVARLRKEKEAQEKQRQDEIRRREDGKKMAAANLKREEEELKATETRAKRAQEKKAEAEHLAKVRAQIEEDKRNRASAFNKEKTARDAESNRLKMEKLRQEREKQEEIQRAKASKARLQFRLGDGSTFTHIFEADDPLQNARDLLISENKAEEPFKLRQVMPSKLFAKDEETKSMRELGLAPSAVLVVIPDYRGSSSTSSGIVNWLWALIFFPINMIIRALSSIFPPARQAAPERQQTPSSSSQPQRRRIADLKDDADRPVYNGNSTNQL